MITHKLARLSRSKIVCTNTAHKIVVLMSCTFTYFSVYGLLLKLSSMTIGAMQNRMETKVNCTRVYVKSPKFNVTLQMTLQN